MGPEDDDLLQQGGDLNAQDDHEDPDVDEDGDLADSDAGDGDDGQGAAGPDGNDQGGKDALGSDEGQARQGQAQVKRGASERIREAIRRAKDAEERAKRLEEALLQRPQTGNAGPDLAAERATQRRNEIEQARERARLDGDPSIVVGVTERHLREDFDARLQGMQFQMAESADRAEFRSLCASDPLAAKYKNEVEQRLQQERRNGLNFPRETVLNFVLGDAIRKNGGRNLAAQRKKAEPAVRRESVSAPRGTQRSDVAGGGRNTSSRDAVRKRLENLEI